MSIIAAYVYRDGKRERPVTLDGLCAKTLAPGEFVWIGVLEPEEAELRTLQTEFDLHPLAVEDALSTHQLPKVDVYGDHLFVVALTARFSEDGVGYGETAIFVGPNHIITVRHGSDRPHTELRAQLEAAPSLLRHGVDYVLHAVLDFIVDGYPPVVQAIEEEVLQMEQRALETFLDRAEITRIFNLRRDLLRFRRILGPMEEVAGRLEHLDSPCLDEEVRPYFGDLHDHVRHVASDIETLKDVLAWVFEASTLLEAQRQGVITRKLAAWAAILAVPTAIAGIYGMNFEHMPELKWLYGYPVILAAIVAVCIGLYVRFRRARWL